MCIFQRVKFAPFASAMLFSESRVLVCCPIFSHATAGVDSEDPHLCKYYIIFLPVSRFDVYLGRFFIRNRF